MSEANPLRIIENGRDSSPEWDYIADYLKPVSGDEDTTAEELKKICREELALTLIKGARNTNVFNASPDIAVIAERMAVALMGAEWVEDIASTFPIGFIKPRRSSKR